MHLFSSSWLRCAALVSALASPGSPQTPPPAEPTAPPNPNTTWSLGPVNVSGLIDGYYSHNFNHPGSGTNKLRNFDTQANAASLNMGKATFEHAPDPIGFRVDLGFGRAFDVFHATEPSRSNVSRHFMQAYVSAKPSQLRGLQIDFGKFATSAGAEVTETHLNWNYSRSLLFANGPYYHVGIRSTMPITKNFTGGVQLVNGWNNLRENNSGKTVGLTGAFTFSRFSWFNNYYVGPENNDTTRGNRHFYDTVLLFSPHARVNAYVNYDYGTNRHPDRTSSRFQGIAGAARVAVTPRLFLSPRLEWYRDSTGFITGTAQTLKEMTMTADFRMIHGVLFRTEYRHDWSNAPYFDRGGANAPFRDQHTVLIGFIAFFGPKL